MRKRIIEETIHISKITSSFHYDCNNTIAEERIRNMKKLYLIMITADASNRTQTIFDKLKKLITVRSVLLYTI